MNQKGKFFVIWHGVTLSEVGLFLHSWLKLKHSSQDNKAGTMGRKYWDSSKIGYDNGKDVFTKYVSERKKAIEEGKGKKNTYHAENRPISVPTSQENSSPFKCYHTGCIFNTDDEEEYHMNGAQRHLKNPLLYPSKNMVYKPKVRVGKFSLD